MASLNAKAVAKEVSEILRQSKRVDLGKIIRKKGYAESTSKKPKLVTTTKSYQEELKPFLDRLVVHRNKILEAMENKKLDIEEYKVLVDALNKSNHDIQLLSGGSTEKVVVLEISKEAADKYEINKSSVNNPKR